VFCVLGVKQSGGESDLEIELRTKRKYKMMVS